MAKKPINTKTKPIPNGAKQPKLTPGIPLNPKGGSSTGGKKK